MTIERVITSHSERAVAVEHGRIANRLASSASLTGQLLRVLRLGKNPSDLSSMMSIARGFIEEATRYSENKPKIKYTQLIPYVVWDEAVRDQPGLQDLAGSLAALLEKASNASADEDPEYRDLLDSHMEMLNRLAQRLDEEASLATKTSILA